uniref:Large ribosomal subunit protein bL35m n=1 Tax=Romanomermis culicivorax TaxID=13658 RepID=A0A915L073_ROMCU
MSIVNLAPLLRQKSAALINQIRNHVRYPPHTLHIRFDPTDGRKIPCKDVLDRFKRLNCGLWIRGKPGRYKKRYMKDEPFLTESLKHETTKLNECQMMDKVMNRFWVRPKYYIEDPYEAYHVRHGLSTPRVGYDNRLSRERSKILLEDTVTDQYFYDR